MSAKTGEWSLVSRERNQAAADIAYSPLIPSSLSDDLLPQAKPQLSAFPDSVSSEEAGQELANSCPASKLDPDIRDLYQPNVWRDLASMHLAKTPDIRTARALI
jgi:hypothetical protein